MSTTAASAAITRALELLGRASADWQNGKDAVPGPRPRGANERGTECPNSWRPPKRPLSGNCRVPEPQRPRRNCVRLAVDPRRHYRIAATVKRRYAYQRELGC